MSIFDKVGDFLVQTTEQYTNETLKNDGGKKLKNKRKDPKTPKRPPLQEPVTETPQGEKAKIKKKLNDSFISMADEFDASMKEMKRKKGKGGR